VPSQLRVPVGMGILEPDLKTRFGILSAAPMLQTSIIEEIESRGIESADVFRGGMATLAVHEMLRAKATGWSDIAGANVFDSEGVLINSSKRWPVADVKISDRDYFRRMKNNPSLNEEIEIVPTRFGRGWAIVFARRVSGPHGEFFGVVNRAITPAQLESFFASAGLREDSSISMHRRNGQLLARVPQIEAMIGQNFRKGSAEQVAVVDRPFMTTSSQARSMAKNASSPRASWRTSRCWSSRQSRSMRRSSPGTRKWRRSVLTGTRSNRWLIKDALFAFRQAIPFRPTRGAQPARLFIAKNIARGNGAILAAHGDGFDFDHLICDGTSRQSCRRPTFPDEGKLRGALVEFVTEFNDQVAVSAFAKWLVEGH
jgi:hypothetical protein